MKYKPFENLDKFLFSDSDDKILEKILGNYNKINIGVKEEVGTDYTTIFIQDIDLFIVFKEDESAIRYMETTLPIEIENCNLHKASLDKIEQHFSILDSSLIVDKEGSIISKKYGFIVSKEFDQKGNSILIFNKDYLDEKTPTAEEIIKYYLGNDANDE